MTAAVTPLPSDIGWRNAAARPVTQEIDWQGDYEVLRDTIIAAFNPADEDAADMTAAIDRAWQFIVAQPCHCPNESVLQDHASLDTVTDYYGLQCARCVALGRSNDKQVER